MLRTLSPLLDQLERADSDEQRHNAAMDLVESLLRHLAVVAIAVYRHSESRNRGVDRLLATRLHWPSMGCWATFVRAISRLDPDRLPSGFHASFLAPLAHKSRDEALSRAYRAILAIVETASSQDGAPQSPSGSGRRSALDFFDLMVRYRNANDGHGTHSLTSEQRDALGDLCSGVEALCTELDPIWRAHPIYVTQRSSSAGASFHRLVPLVDDPQVGPLDSLDDALVADRLYVLLDRAGKALASLYPIALWSGDDVLFLNGSPHFTDIKYLGFVDKTQLKTDKHERAFCSFVLPFMGGGPLEVTDLSDARVKAQAETLRSAGWSFPSLRKGLEVGPEGARFRLVRKLGRGGMAEVWQARSLPGLKDVAVKFLLDPQHAARFRREARALKTWSRQSDRIVGYVSDHYDPHPARRLFFVVMELLPGGTLADRVEPTGPLDYERLLSWMADAAQGLRVIHAGGGLHRDIKPDNLMLGWDERVKLGDLGLVGQAGPTGGSLVTTGDLTQPGEAVGTFEFSAREQLRAGIGDARADGRSDLFSLGASFYYLLTGELPFGSGGLVRILHAQEQALQDGEGPASVLSHRPDCPPLLDRLIRALLQVEPDRRPASADEVIAVIEEARKEVRGDKANVNLKIIGSLGEDGPTFAGLMPDWCSTFVFKVWLTVMVLQFAVMVPLSYFRGTLTRIEPARFGLVAEGQAWDLHPFVQDYMFLAWNLIPFVLIALLYRARPRIQGLMQSLWALDRDRSGDHWRAAARRNDRWVGFLDSPACKGLLFVAACGAVVPQVTKVTELARNLEAYWWSWSVDPAAYVVRAVALSVDMIGIMLTLFVVVAMVDTIARVLRGARLRIDLRSSDGAAGVADVGLLVSLYIPYLAVVAVNTVIGTMDHRGQDPMQVAFDWLVLAGLALLSMAVLIWPMLPVRQKIRAFRRSELARLSATRRGLEGRMRTLQASATFETDHADQHSALARMTADLREAERAIARMWTWPISRPLALLMLALTLLPMPVAWLLWLVGV